MDPHQEPKSILDRSADAEARAQDPSRPIPVRFPADWGALTGERKFEGAMSLYRAMAGRVDQPISPPAKPGD